MPTDAPLRLAIFASGRGSNALSIIRAVRTGRLSRVEPVIVVSDKIEAPVIGRVRQEGVEAREIVPRSFSSKEAYEGAILEILKERSVDAVALAGYMRLVGPVLIEAFPDRILNIHPSLLPSFPGLQAQKQAIDYGVRVTGVTVHFVDLLMDHGPVILQKCVPVFPEDTEETLSQRILPVEHEAYLESLDALSRGRLRIEGRRVLWQQD
ncbi:MAG: phosphoribosylglycinamide formyltransferase [Leptospirillia bacterium]